MRILFYTGGVSGSGHLVLGAAIAAAFRRMSSTAEFSILSVQNDFSALLGRFGVPLIEIPLEDNMKPGIDDARESSLHTAIDSIEPDILVSDIHWPFLHSFIRDLPCRKVILFRQIDPRFFNLRLPDRDILFRPDDYDLVIKTEPGFELPFPSIEIDPIIIRDRDEIMGAEAARADLGLSARERSCLFAFNGAEGEGLMAWKSFSYLEDEGWKVVRSDNRVGGLFPAVDWYNAFDMLVCGAGYSAFWEARYLNKEAFFVPFKRRFEDQARRIAVCSDYRPDSNGADRLAEMLLGL